MNFITRHRLGNIFQAFFALFSMPIIMYLFHKSGTPYSDTFMSDIRVLFVAVSVGCLILLIFSIKEIFKSKEKIIEEKRKIILNRKKATEISVSRLDEELKKFDEKVKNLN